MKLYTPGDRDFTSSFGRKVLAGEKKLLELKDVNWLEKYPQDKELGT